MNIGIRRSTSVALAAILLAASALRLYHLAHKSAWTDEIQRISWAKGYDFEPAFGVTADQTGVRLSPQSLGTALHVVNRHNPPLYGMLLNGWMQLAGADDDFTLRLLSVFFGLLTVVTAFLAGWVVGGDAVGVTAAVLVTFSPFQVGYAQEINHYTSGAAFIGFCYWFYFLLLREPRLLWKAGVIVAGILSLYTHYFCGIALLFQAAGLGLAQSARGWKQVIAAWLPYFAILALFAPYAPSLPNQLREMTDVNVMGAFGGLRRLQWELRTIVAYPWLFEYAFGARPLLAVVFLIGSGLLVVRGAQALDRPLGRIVVLNAVGPIAMVVLLYFVTRRNSFLWPHYQIFFMLPLILLVAVALVRGPLGLTVLVSLGLAVSFFIGLRYYYGPFIKEDWRGTAGIIAARAAPGEKVVIYPSDMVWALARYLPTQNRLFGLDDRVEGKIGSVSPGRSALWFLSAWTKESPVAARLHTTLACRYSRAEEFPVRSVTDMRLTRYTFSPPSACLTPKGEATVRLGTAPTGAASVPGHEVAYLEEPADASYVVPGCALLVRGWLVSTEEASGVALTLDGRMLEGVTLHREARPEVQAAFSSIDPKVTRDSGFWATFDPPRIECGEHVLAIGAIRPDGAFVPLRKITILTRALDDQGDMR